MTESAHPPLITTILPTYRRPERLKRAIQSVLDQTYPHFQLCIYDNASEDATAAIVEEFARRDSRVKYLCHPQNIGATQNFQFGLSRVETPFFSFLSDDDFLLPEFYETTLAGLRKFPEAAFVAGAVIDINEKSQVVDIILHHWPDQEYFLPPDGLMEMIGKYSNWTGILFRKEACQEIGGLDHSLKAIDVDYVFRIAARFPFVITKKKCAVFVQHASSYSGCYGFKLIYPGWPRMMEKIQDDQRLPQEIRQAICQKLQSNFHNLLLMNAMRSLEKKNFEELELIAKLFKENTNKRLKYLLLAFLIKTCQAIPYAQKLLILLLRVRRFWRRGSKRLSLPSSSFWLKKGPKID